MHDDYTTPDRGDAGEQHPEVPEGPAEPEPDTPPAEPDEVPTEEHDTLGDDEEARP